MSKFSRDLLEYSLYGPLSRQKEDPTALQKNPCRNRMNGPPSGASESPGQLSLSGR